MRRVLVLAAAAALVLLCGCGGDEDGSATVTAPSPATTATAGETEPPGETYTVADAGVQITVKTFVPYLTLSAQAADAHADLLGDGVIALVELEVTRTPDSTASVTGSSFSVVCGDGEHPGVDSGVFDAELAGGGYDTFAPVAPGQSVAGWVPFVLPTVPEPGECELSYQSTDDGVLSGHSGMALS
ncbi:MAG: hypothetical protein FWF02_07195 [Micrococcales bacterium]|nr:hypothetical protein [Micrococcales bacterium]MCL2667477.1 hypothetical protein [Micrococcales bacterium]